MPSVLAQYNESTGKVSYDAITGKVQVVANSIACSQCNAGYHIPLALRVVIADFEPPDDGCCSGEGFGDDVSAELTGLPDVNGTYDLPYSFQSAPAGCCYFDSDTISEWGAMSFDEADCEGNAIVSYDGTEIVYRLCIKATVIEFTASLDCGVGCSLDYYFASETYANLGYTDCSDFVDGINNGDEIELTPSVGVYDWCADLGTCTISKVP